MANSLRYRIDMPYVNEDGTIEVIDTDFIADYPFTWQYKLYETEEENMKRLLSVLYSIYPETYELTPRFRAYVDDRKALYDKVEDYRKIVEEIKCSNNFEFEKKVLIKSIDEFLSKLYPYPTKASS